MNTGAPWPTVREAEARVLGIQTKLHQWATDDPNRRFADLYNLVCDPAFLLIAWRRVSRNKGARTAGVDRQTRRHIYEVLGEETFLTDLRADLKARMFKPLRVRERHIPKPGSATKRRRLGIPTLRDRVVQAALKLVLEPIFEADFHPCSYGFRPNRSAHDAIAEIRMFANHSYQWVLEGDIEACFDRIDQTALMEQVRARIADRRVLSLVKAFLKAGILTEDGHHEDSNTGTPQGGILSPLLSNIALSVIDNQCMADWHATADTDVARRVARVQRRRRGLANWRLIRYADDFVIMVAGTRVDAEQLRTPVAETLQRIGLRLSEEKTRICHIDEGFDFLGHHIRRAHKRGNPAKRHIYTYPSKKALVAIKTKVRMLTGRSTNQSLAALLMQLTPVLRGWANYHRHGSSKATLSYLHYFTVCRILKWLRRKHPKRSRTWLNRRYMTNRQITHGMVELFNPASVAVTRYRYRGYTIPTQWAKATT